jgi:hypothetical protein
VTKPLSHKDKLCGGEPSIASCSKSKEKTENTVQIEFFTMQRYKGAWRAARNHVMYRRILYIYRRIVKKTIPS